MSIQSNVRIFCYKNKLGYRNRICPVFTNCSLIFSTLKEILLYWERIGLAYINGCGRREINVNAANELYHLQESNRT